MACLNPPSPNTEQPSCTVIPIPPRHPDLKATELPEKMRSVEAKDSAWLTYWKGNPIKAFTHANASGEQWFTVHDDHFVPTFSVEPQHIERFHQLVQELVDLRLAQYVERRVET